jgi:hypothetical protein
VPVAVPIRVGITDGQLTEVLEGLAEGDDVITDSTDAGKPAAGTQPGGGQGLRRIF